MSIKVRQPTPKCGERLMRNRQTATEQELLRE